MSARKKTRKWPCLIGAALIALAIGAAAWAGRPGASTRATQQPRAHFPVASVDWVVPSPTPTPTATATPLPPLPPSIDPQLPGELYAGRAITVPLNITDPNDNLAETRAEQQLGMGDKYAGTEYATAQALPQLEIVDGDLTLKPDYPGNYRIWITARDTTDLESRMSVDVPVTWAPGENPFEIRGISVSFWGPPEWTKPECVPQGIQDAKDLGANYLQLDIAWAMPSSTSPDILPCTADLGCFTPSDTQVRTWIGLIHSSGMSVMLRTTLCVEAYNAVVNPKNWTPALVMR